MPTFEEIKDSLRSKLYEIAMQPGSPARFSEEVLLSLLPEIGHGMMKAVFDDLSNEGDIHQATLQPISYTLTPQGIKNTETAILPQTSQASAQPNTKGPFSTFKDHLLIALARKESSDGQGYYDLKKVADEAGIYYEDGWPRKAAYSLRDYGQIREAFTMGQGPDGGLNAEMTADGLEAVERLIANFNPAPSDQLTISTIPASDRIVRRSDNEEVWMQAAEGVVALRDAMTEANDYGTLDDDEFEQKLSEVRALQIMLDAPQVQWDVLDQFATKTVKYLAMEFANNAIGHTASALFGYLIALTQGAL